MMIFWTKYQSIFCLLVIIPHTIITRAARPCRQDHDHHNHHHCQRHSVSGNPNHWQIFPHNKENTRPHKEGGLLNPTTLRQFSHFLLVIGFWVVIKLVISMMSETSQRGVRKVSIETWLFFLLMASLRGPCGPKKCSICSLLRQTEVWLFVWMVKRDI